MKLILASNSPRRRDILSMFGFQFKVVSSDYEEKVGKLAPKRTAEFFAYNKAKSVFEKLSDKEKRNTIVIGADTIVTFGKDILCKPKDEKDAFKMLKRLSNKTHKVITGFALIGQNIKVNSAEITKVTFNKLDDELIKKYIEDKKPFDKAGSYGIQDGYPLVNDYKGSYNNIVGLPIERIVEEFKKRKLSF